MLPNPKFSRKKNQSKDSRTLILEETNSNLNVLGMLDRQEEVINALLLKYSDRKQIDEKALFSNNKIGSEKEYEKKKMKSIDRKEQDRKFNYRGRAHSTLNISEKRYSKIDSSPSITLPHVNEKNREGTQELQSVVVRKKKVKPKNEFIVNFIKQRKKHQLELYQIYGDPHDRSSSRIQISTNLRKKSPKKVKSPKSQARSRQKQHTSQSKISLKTKNEEKDFDLPLGIPKTYQELEEEVKGFKDEQKADVESDDSDSEKSEVIQVSYYERDFRTLMKNQCMEELNFLFYNKSSNQGAGMEMKQWASSLMSMIEKHDKEVCALRRRAKYLHHMDDNFFSMGIYQTDGL